MIAETQAAPRAAFFWLLAAVCAGGFVFANEPVRWALLRMQPLAIALLFAAVCAGLGSLTLRLTASRGGEPPVALPLHGDLLTSFGLGCGIAGAMIFVAGLLHALHPAFFIGMLCLGLLCFLVSLPAWWRGRTVFLRPASSVGWVVLGGTLLLILPFVVAPELSTDALEYHLLIPKIDLLQNGLARIPGMVESNYPGLAEQHFVALLASGNDIAPKCFHFLCALFVLGAIFRIARQVAPESDGVLAAALFFMMPVAALTAGWAWNDMLFTLFVLLSLHHLIEKHFIVAGVFFGLATWTKYTFVLAAIGMAFVLLRGWRSRWWSGRDLLKFAAPVVAIALIWMTRNAVETGNPVYPFLNSLFHSPFWSEASARYFHSTLTHYEIPQWHWWTYLAFPVLLTIAPRVIDVQAGVLPLILLPLAFMGDGRGPESDGAARPGLSVLRTYAVAVVVGWLLIGTEARSLLTMFAVLSILYSVTVDRVRGWRALILGGFALNVVILLVSTEVLTDPYRYFLGRESKSAYIERMDPKQRVYHWLDAQPSVSAALLVGLHDPFYLGKRAQFSSCCDPPVAETLVRRCGSAAAMAAALRRDGITHVAVRTPIYSRENADGLYSWSAAEREVFRTFLATACTPVVKIGDTVVFAIR